ncbi:hypothetical protein [Halobacteriovorax sp.]|uniref:hypothetical protein n=1 Tax=Halobacteriovorax sp. TaxID=2020862 RepID=UPI003566DB64
MKNHFFSFSIFFLSLLFSSNSYSISDSFTHKEWSGWGNGIHIYDQYVGQKENGSLHLSVSTNQKSTFYRKFTNLNRNEYTISFWIKGSRVQEGKWNRSFWTFYDGGHGEKSCFEDIRGSFGWSLVKCPVKVKNGELSFWFRLQSTGSVWIDDFSINTNKSKDISYTLNYIDPTPFKYIEDERCLQKARDEVRDIYPRGEDYSPFNSFLNVIGEKVAHLEKAKFYNLDIASLSDIPWSSYDFIELVINLQDRSMSEVQMAIEDIESDGYWSKLNFKSTLVRGDNTILFPLKRAVGERGSTKDGRKIDYEALTKIWLSIDPDGRFPNSDLISLKRITLRKRKHVQTFKGLRLFDFVERSDDAYDCFNPVTPFHVLTANDEFGFSKKVDKSHDSIYSDKLNRDTLLVNENEFKVRLPNGKYKIFLNWNMLGYWDVPFWHKRTLSIQDEVVKIETRSNVDEYLKDFLRFENIEPSHGDHPWDLYLSDVFKPLEYEVEVKNNQLKLVLSGDESGIALNWMAIYPVIEKKKGAEFIEKLNRQLRDDFKLIGRYSPGVIKDVQETHVSVLDSLSRVTPLGVYRVAKKKINKSTLRGVKNVFNFVAFSNNEESLEISVESKQSKCFSYEWNRGQYQFISQDRNHETYIIGTKQLRKLNTKSIIPTKINNQLLLNLVVLESCAQSNLNLTAKIKLGDKAYSFPISINILKGSLDDLDIPVGFLGFNPLSYKYYRTDYNSSDVNKSIKDWSFKYLERVTKDGFTTFSTANDPTDPLFNNIMNSAKISNKIRTVFSYGSDKDLTEYLLKSNSAEINLFKKKLKQWPKFVHTFSDEAGGYSDRMKEDISIGTKLKKKAPFLLLGGFSSMDKSHRRINKIFDEGSYSNLNNKELRNIKKWGIYNPASLPLDNPQFAFGAGLYVLRSKGLSHLLGWHLSANQNYPYYDLDGRENDAMMLYPTSSGELLSTIKYEQAIQGVIDYKLLKFLEIKAKSSGHQGKKALSWLKTIRNKNILDRKKGYINNKPPKLLSSGEIRTKVFYFLKKL